MQHLHFIPIHSPFMTQAFDLSAEILNCISAAGESLQDGDILIVSSKYAAIAEGRIVTLSEVQAGAAALELAARYKIEPQMAELVIQESDHIFGGIPGFLMSVKDNVIAPNAGIDNSNIPSGQVVLYPVDAFDTAARLRLALKATTGAELGIILSDSRLMPGRTGTTGLALGVSGFVPVVDERGRPDLAGVPLKVSQRAVADNLCAGAELLMGEADEGIPLVIARATGIPLTGANYTWQDVAIDYHEDLYVAIMGGGSAEA